jgi:hypothetical protein
VSGKHATLSIGDLNDTLCEFVDRHNRFKKAFN